MPPGWDDLAEDAAHKRRLAGPGLTHQVYEFSAVYVKIHIFKRDDVRLKYLCDAGKLYVHISITSCAAPTPERTRQLSLSKSVRSTREALREYRCLQIDPPPRHSAAAPDMSGRGTLRRRRIVRRYCCVPRPRRSSRSCGRTRAGRSRGRASNCSSR
ncbi:hypothetical protein SDC9_172855 [bioreactor metagenome]|uniref:Uncharacterized protein n=1 Tax=bioreactor metagenome TaxID=1076179 RepID=A0A645GGZ3_9ZZZZ